MTFAIRDRFAAQAQVLTLRLDEKVSPLHEPIAHVWGYGRVLLREQSSGRRLISVAQQQIVNGRLKALTLQGCEAKIQNLLSTIHRVHMPEEIRRRIEEWANQFTQIASNYTEQRAHSFGIFVTQIIRPALLQKSYSEEQQDLLRLEDLCCDILKGLIAKGETVDHFLSECKEGVREQRLFRENVDTSNRVTIAQKSQHSQASLIIDGRIEQACISVLAKIN